MDSRITTIIKQQGLLSVPLLHKQAMELEHYAILNGTKNNLCLDGNSSEQSEWYRKMAWSSGNNTYIVFSAGMCHIFRFDRPQVESYDEKLVFDNAGRFFDYLGKSTSNLENSIVPYVLRTYRSIRNEIRTENSGLDSLKVLLYLLAYSRDGEKVNLDEWGIKAQDGAVFQAIDHNKWEMITESFTKGVLIDKWLKPEVDLILRHTAGKLFEEANYIAYLPSQLNLFPDERIKYSYDTTQDGAYFTPSYVARSIVEEALRNIDLEDKDELTIFDPACGASGFLVEALRQLKKKGFDKSVKVIGWDKAETAVLMSRFVLNFEKQEWDDLLKVEVEQCDSLAEENVWPQDVDILLMNPPFLSWDKMKDTPEMRNQVLRILPGIGRANLSAAFLAKAVETLSPTGVLGAVVPTRLLNDQRYAPLREIIRSNVAIRMIGSLGSFVFAPVLTYTSMIVATKGMNDLVETTVLWTNNVSGATESGLKALRKYHYTNIVTAEENFSVYETQFDAKQRSWKTDNYQDLELKSRIDKAVRDGQFKRVSELFNVHLGARTGNNKVFIVTEDYIMSLPENERPFYRPSVDNLAIDNGHLYRMNYVFYPYSKDIERIDTEERLRELLPVTYSQKLLPAKEQLIGRSSLKGNPRWWELSEHCAWQEVKELKFVSSEFGHAGSFAIDYEGEYVVERGTMWEFRKKGWTPKVKYLEAYLAIMNSPYINMVLGIYGEQLAGGDVFKLGKSYIGSLPLPDLSQSQYERYIPELRRFAQLMKDDLYWDSEELRSLVKEIFLYGK